MTRVSEAWDCIKNRMIAAGWRARDKDQMMAAARLSRKVKFVSSPRYPELQDPTYYGSSLQMKNDQRADWPLANDELLQFTRKLFLTLRRNGLPSYVHTCYRAPDLQRRLKEAGHSQVADGPHLRCCAVDIVHAHYHWNAPKTYWNTIGQFGHDIIRANNYSIEWGGDFKSLYDPAHWQIKDWKSWPRISEQAMSDRETGEVIHWKRSPFSAQAAQPTLSNGESYYTNLQNEGKTWKTALKNKTE